MSDPIANNQPQSGKPPAAELDLRDLTYGYYVRKRTPRVSFPDDWLNAGVLEIGAGHETCERFLKSPLYVLLDIDANNAGSSHFVQADAQQLPFAEGAFDKFIALSIIEHLPDPLKALKDLHLACAKGGCVLVPTLDEFPFLYDPVNWILKKLKRKPARFGIGGYGHRWVLHSEQWKELFTSAGFRVSRVERGPRLDLFEALEFFLLSIPFSRYDYVSLMSKVHGSPGRPSLAKKILLGVSPVLRRVYSLFYSLNLKFSGAVGYYFWLEK